MIFVWSPKIRFGDLSQERKESNLIRVEVPPGSKAVLTGVPHGMNMEPMKSRLESGDPPVDPYMCSQASNNVGPLGGLGVFFNLFSQSLPAQCTGCQIPRCWTPD